MSISIRFLTGVQKADDEHDFAIGQITLGSFVEEFESILTVWSPERYEQQWREGIQTLLNGAAKSCLITSLWLDSNGYGFSWWPLYRIADQVVAQNALIWDPEMFDRNFDPNEPYRFIPEHRSVSADGQQISEWWVPLNEIIPWQQTS
jgi:CdiI N-terminal domain